MSETKKRDAAIQAEGLTFTYGAAGSRLPEKDTARAPIISGLELTLYKGEAAALTGPNGAGKTTLGKLLTGILKPASGKVILFGKNAESLSLSDIGQKIGYCFQNPTHQLFTASVEEEIGFGPVYRGVPKEQAKRITEDLLQLLQLQAVRKSFPLNLSQGEKKRVALAAALALSPEFLILDEPTAGLDHQRIGILNEILKELRRRGTGMLLISHNDEFLRENADRFLTIERGQIFHDRSI